MTSLEQFARIVDPIGENMIWKKAAENQFEQFRQICDKIGGSLSVVSSHTSKSIELPVVQIRTDRGRFLLRDNFHDLSLCVIWRSDVALDYSDIYTELDWDWYLGQIERCEGYTWRGWSQEEIEDPRITRVLAPTICGKSTFWNSNSPEEKERWLARFDSTEWYYRDWSSGKLVVEGEMGPDCKMYRAEKTFSEGITSIVERDTLNPYEPGRKNFTLCLYSYDDVERIMKKIMN